MNERVRFYDDTQGHLAIETNHQDADDFLYDISIGLMRWLRGWIGARVSGPMPELTVCPVPQLHAWLMQAVEISNKLKGYQAEVSIEQVIRAGAVVPTKGTLVVTVDRTSEDGGETNVLTYGPKMDGAA